ncbi:MAG TPA: hypothetical protein VIL36_05205, partial [Acidimicrobiales bacterium]
MTGDREDLRPASDWPAPRRHPASYPGAAPTFPYLLVGDRVRPLAVRADGGRVHVTTADGTPVDALLRDLGVAPLADRVPSVAYGANRSPDSLALKFEHHGAGGAPPVVPVLAVRLAGVDAVGAGISGQGFVYADVVDSPGTRLSALLPLLDHRQLVAVHDSEGLGSAYDCAWLPDVELVASAAAATTDAGATGSATDSDGGGDTVATLGAMAYVGRQPAFRDPDAEQPLAFATVPAVGRRFPALHQVDLLARVIAATGIGGGLARRLGHADGHPGAGEGEPPAATLAAELIGLLNGQWWYHHHTGEPPLA